MSDVFTNGFHTARMDRTEFQGTEMPALTPDQLKRRAALIEDFRTALTCAMWEAIEEADPELLAADDGTPYGSLVTESLRTSSLDQMVAAATGAACKALENFL